jgi:hypothetical protein
VMNLASESIRRKPLFVVIIHFTFDFSLPRRTRRGD